MIAESVLASPGHSQRGPQRTGWQQASTWLLAVPVVVGAVNFMWQLGSPSYFVDEVLSIEHALPPIGTLLSVVSKTENTPWTYFFGLHEWLHVTGSQSEWVTRLPSAIAGIALVLAVYWMARAFLKRSGALLAGLLAALSPLVLEYAQQVRVYVFAMLAATLAVGFLVRAMDRGERELRMLVLGSTLAVLAMWLHYTAALVMVPLGIWLVSQRAITPRRRGWCAVGLASGALIELPLFLTQYHYTPNGGLGNLGAISWVNTFKVVGTPFDGRFNEGLNAYRVVGALLVGGALGVVVARDRRNVGTRALLLALGATPLVVILLLGVAGKDIVISRYTAVAAPFLLTTMAAAVSSVRRPAAAILGAALLGVSVWGLVNSHRVSGFYAPARQTMALIAHHERPGDIVEVPGDAGDDIPLAYYGQRLLHPALPYVPEGQHATILAAVHQHRRFWLIGHLETPPTSHTVLARAIAELANAIRYRPLLLSEYRGGVTYIVALIGARR